MDRLQSMRVFQQVVDEGSFAAAARSFDMSSAAVTRLVSDLEDHLGVRLLQRTTRRLALTDAGDAYLSRLRHILSDIDEAQSAVQAQSGNMAGLVRILTPSVFAVHVLAPLVAEWGRQFPDVVLDIHTDTSSPAAQAAAVEDYDLTLLGAADDFDANLIARPIASSNSVLCASPAYLTAHGTPQQPADLTQHRVIQVRPMTVRPKIFRLINPLEDNLALDIAVHPVLLVNHSDTAIRACVDGAGISQQSVAIVGNLLASGELVRVLSPWMMGRYTLYAAMPSRRFIPARTRAFLEFLTEHARSTIRQIEVPR